MGRSSLHNLSWRQLRQQLGVRLYSTWYNIRPEVGTLHDLSGYQQYFLSVVLIILSTFIIVLSILYRLDVKKPGQFQGLCPLRFHQGSAVGQCKPRPQTPICFSCYAHASCSYNLSIFCATDVDLILLY